MKTYEGHRSWNAWNVSLWINNDESIYNCALESLRRLPPTDRHPEGYKPKLFQAVNKFMLTFRGEKTPDGAIYNRMSVKEALKEIEE